MLSGLDLVVTRETSHKQAMQCTTLDLDIDTHHGLVSLAYILIALPLAKGSSPYQKPE
jgi:hypothetical protein